MISVLNMTWIVIVNDPELSEFNLISMKMMKMQFLFFHKSMTYYDL